MEEQNSRGPLLLVTPWYPPDIGGVAVVTQRLRRLFAGAGVQTSVWVSAVPDANSIDRDPDDGQVAYRWIPSTVFYSLTARSLLAAVARAPLALWRAWRFVHKRRIKTVVLLYPIGYAWPFVVMRWLGVVNLVSSCHGNDILQFSRSSTLARQLFRGVLGASDAITVPAAHLIDVAKETLPTRTLPIWLIPNCVDDSYFVPRPAGVVRNERPTLIHISAFTPRKRTLDIVRAFALARLPEGSRLLMVGEGPERHAAQELAAELKVADSVEFVGAPEDVRPYLWESDVLVMASDEESGPLTLLEAMACEVPFIMTPWGIALTLPQNEYGALVPARQPAALAAAMESMLADRTRLRSMGQRGRLKVLEQFGQATYLERHLQLIDAVERGQAHRTVDFSVPPLAS